MQQQNQKENRSKSLTPNAAISVPHDSIEQARVKSIKQNPLMQNDSNPNSRVTPKKRKNHQQLTTDNNANQMQIVNSVIGKD